MLNTVGRMSGIASRTRDFREAMLRAAGADCKTRLLDTRKTTPGLRVLEKYAVRCGGGHCHRLGLHDAVMIKDNHIAGLTPSEASLCPQRSLATVHTLHQHRKPPRECPLFIAQKTLASVHPWPCASGSRISRGMDPSAADFASGLAGG